MLGMDRGGGILGSMGEDRGARRSAFSAACVLLACACLACGSDRQTTEAGTAARTKQAGAERLTGTIVFQSDRDGRTGLYRLDLPGGRVERLLPGGDWDDESPVWSPDGRRIAFASTRADKERRRFDIFIVDAGGRAVKRLTDHPSDEREPSWASDGRSLFFSGERDGRSEIYRVFLETKKVERVTRHLVERAVLPSASPDGRHLAYASQLVDYQVQLLDLRNGRTRQLSAGSGACRPRWSPDGRRVAYVENHGETTAIVTFDVVANQWRRIFATPTLWSYDPAWSPDGARLAFVVSREHHDGEDWDLAVLDAASPAGFTRLTSGPGNDHLPDWK
jgi:TolB protein